MADTILARGWTIEVYDGSDYQSIGGINTFTLSSSVERSDGTTFDSEGNAEHTKSQLGKTITVEGYYFEDDTGTRDAGQEAVETLCEALGSAAEETMHIASPDGGYEVWMDGTFNLADIGGGNNDNTSWGFEFERTGATMSSDPNA